MPQSWKVTSQFFLLVSVISPQSWISQSMSSTSLLSGYLLPCKNSRCITSCEISSFLAALCRILRMVAQGANPTGNLLSSLIKALTVCKFSNSLPVLCLCSFSIRAYIFYKRRMSELILAIFLETKVTASFCRMLVMLGYLQQIISSTCWQEQGLKMMVSNLRRDCNLASSLRVRSMTLEIRTRMSLAPTHSHSSMLYRNFWSLMNWSISSRMMILVSSLFPIPDLRRSCKACEGFFSFTPYSRERMPQQTWLADHILMQFRYATLTVLELDLKKSITFVMSEVLPQPVFPWRHRGVVVPFSEMAMKSKIRQASSFLPGTSLATFSNRFLSQGDWKPSLSSLFSLGGTFLSYFLSLRQISSSVSILSELMMVSSASGSRQPSQQRSIQSQVSASRLNSLSYAHPTQFGSFMLIHIKWVGKLYTGRNCHLYIDKQQFASSPHYVIKQPSF